MIPKQHPITAAFSDMTAEKKYRGYISPRRRDRLERKTRQLGRDLITVWIRMRRYPEDHPKFLKLEDKAQKLIDEISGKLTSLSLFEPNWMIKAKEEFEQNF